MTSKERKKLKGKHRRFLRTKAKNWCTVYALKDDTGTTRYIGQTRMILAERLALHWKQMLKDLRTANTLSPCQQWLLEMRQAMRIVTIEVIDPEGVWDTSEAVWIDRYLFKGADLTNVLSRVPLEATEEMRP
jgi:hypothetical protein